MKQDLRAVTHWTFVTARERPCLMGVVDGRVGRLSPSGMNWSDRHETLVADLAGVYPPEPAYTENEMSVMRHGDQPVADDPQGREHGLLLAAHGQLFDLSVVRDLLEPGRPDAALEVVRHAMFSLVPHVGLPSRSIA